ncbi:DUF366 family protein [Methanolobus halotolerans]|uniref:DUF366 domain-containing protein n=1 Tax=Methanolobus halotolerans TaxID=2052935 RepID=A0A4E0QX37_9EURY|nr:DUF366 family protein [Methanolobus halotolerans]TGC07004.1 DUF366 domain-containing protein [Methanolobus halotolerans]
MECIILDKSIDYDGSQISSLWAYNLADVKADSIIAFRGACDVKIEHMIDLEDKKQGDIIFSEDMLHFIIEHFDSTDLKLVYARQRLFTAITSEVLLFRYPLIERMGDDLFIKGKKLTVSIASTSAVSQKIHLGINVVHDHYGSLNEMGITGDEVDKVLHEIANSYHNEINDIEKDLRKSRPLDVI